MLWGNPLPTLPVSQVILQVLPDSTLSPLLCTPSLILFSSQIVVRFQSVDLKPT